MLIWRVLSPPVRSITYKRIDRYRSILNTLRGESVGKKLWIVCRLFVLNLKNPFYNFKLFSPSHGASQSTAMKNLLNKLIILGIIVVWCFFQMVRKLRTIYSHPNDVDLIVGGMAERPADDSMVGPTFRCLIYEQFTRSRRTDRYFYDSATQPDPFTPGKRNFIFFFPTRYRRIPIYRSTVIDRCRTTASAAQRHFGTNILRQRWQHHAYAA